MAATGWLYSCTYTHDVNFSLQQLRQAVFDRREFTLPGDLIARTDDATLAKAAPRTNDLQKLLKISQELDQALSGLGLDTVDSEQQTRDVRRLLEQVDKKGFVFAAREALESSSTPPATIDELLAQCAAAGTHSILDIQHISPTPQSGAATSLSDEQLQTLFGTTQPTRAMIQSAEQSGKLHELCERWHAVYLTVYEEGEPVEYVFVGVSGD
ncbi:hypothetical protein Pan161_08290 [Gimesia algae]|uniref:Uncharacterized protein n=2 Tax=Gimesia algae TaxID=2527971 RepID=A0A517V8A0_9PLAN|nr:hypothetical protein Pan161_08290 [Gimesia algae]